MTRAHHPTPTIAALVVVGAALTSAACGSAGGSAVPSAVSGPTTSTTTPTAAPAAAAPAGAPDPNAPEVVSAGDIPDNQVYVPVTPPGAGFTVSVPQGWAQSGDAGATVFTDKFNGIRVETRALAAAPDVASVRTQDVPPLQQRTPGFVLGDVQAVRRTAGAAVLVTYDASSPTNAVTGKSVTEAVERYAFWRGGREAVLTLSAPKGSDNVDPWRTVTDSFRWLP